jgi:hypothetical protein
MIITTTLKALGIYTVSGLIILTLGTIAVAVLKVFAFLKSKEGMLALKTAMLLLTLLLWFSGCFLIASITSFLKYFLSLNGQGIFNNHETILVLIEIFRHCGV